MAADGDEALHGAPQCWRSGDFVRVRHLGFGKLRFIDSSEATVEFLRSASDSGRFDMVVPLSDVSLRQPPNGSRCFFLQDGWWQTGLLDWTSDVIAAVTTDSDKRLQLPISQIYVRCDIGIGSPVDVIRGGALYHPGYGTNRSRFMTELLKQRAGGRGMTGLASSRIQLFPHQVEIASRIERDTIQRYLLADEVGLGKTIESGILLRQFLLDHPNGTAVVLVPRLLIPQWESELHGKFGLTNFGTDRVRFVEHGTRGWWNPGPGLLIVEEAHHLAAGWQSPAQDERACYEELERAARECERLLLLSATPLLHNEKNFLAMLHLLDPALYPLEGLGEFTARVASRDTTSLSVFRLLSPRRPTTCSRSTLTSSRTFSPPMKSLLPTWMICEMPLTPGTSAGRLTS